MAAIVDKKLDAIECFIGSSPNGFRWYVMGLSWWYI